jgi:Skp family chaperone for outer membrane proteins
VKPGKERHMRIWYGVGAAILVLLVAINGIWSRSPEKPTRTPHCGLINTAYVLKHWSKASQFSKEMQEHYKPFQTKEQQLREQMLEVQKELLDSSLAQEKRDQLQKRVQNLTDSLQQNSKSARDALQEKSGKQLLALYQDLHEASRRYAEAHDLESVICYADAVTPEDLANPHLIENKLKTSACWPMYMAPGVDISKEILAELEKEKKATPSGD